ncbi:SDR family NAD(P)-dependent oxidoreductase [Novosphingobium sp. Gsoil 351]|uniref:SDR family NAD(P)-dependent oxidoreductase n=1 Tax=Novosphingobium sp. Gsoil 351 TaxID=2675225 RepID=UPI0012B4F314|nr:SDR family NAD(P)-dependent oxidoreductase [Novosphingobium sp. Gsoil 351]QGN54830.1 SDR family NAD(P)-dependent oxidoreductase [Novosphingobium sp. Gsoil 351]
MPQMLIFGLGYTAKALAARLRGMGWTVRATGRDGDCDFAARTAVESALLDSSHVLSSVPPDAAGSDPVLDAFGAALGGRWLGYLSSTGVYGDTGGAWVDEMAPIGTGRRTARSEADLAWQALGARVFRLPGIYGPGRSPLERVASGAAHRINLPGQVFSRVHVADIVSGAIAALTAPSGVYNLADDLPASQNTVIEEACRLLGRAPPPLLSLGQANLSPMARAFYAENRRVANGKAKRVLGWRPLYPSYVDGLRALSATAMPLSATTTPATASADQR